jgi:hypothetical protein
MFTDSLPSQLLLHADGIGSFLILRQAVVTVGPVSSSLVPDIGLVAEPTIEPVRLERVDDDYFLKTAQHSSPPSRRLLAAGERIELSSRCRLTFQLPSAASTSAALDLTGARLPRSDIRRVILMDRDLIIGAPPSAHVFAPAASEPVVLHVRDGQLFCRSSQPITIDNNPVGADTPLPLGQSIRVGDVSFVLTGLATRQR